MEVSSTPLNRLNGIVGVDRTKAAHRFVTGFRR